MWSKTFWVWFSKLSRNVFTQLFIVHTGEIVSYRIVQTTLSCDMSLFLIDHRLCGHHAGEHISRGLVCGVSGRHVQIMTARGQRGKKWSGETMRAKQQTDRQTDRQTDSKGRRVTVRLTPLFGTGFKFCHALAEMLYSAYRILWLPRDTAKKWSQADNCRMKIILEY